MTVVELRVLLHFHTYATREGLENSPAVRDAIGGLHCNGLLDKGGPAGYTTTPLGEAHVRQLKALPIPTATSVFTRFDGTVIE